MFNSLESVRAWNLKCGNKPAELFTPEYWKSLDEQAARLVEEVEELVTAIRTRDRLEAVDAIVDIQYVLDGAVFLSQHDHEGAMQAVCANNDLKVSTSRSEAEQKAGRVFFEKNEDVRVVQSEFEGKHYYSIKRNSDNKIMKPVDHPKVDLSRFVAGADTHELFVVQKPACAICSGLIINLTKVLGIKRLTVLEPFDSKADNEFCVDNALTIGDVAYYNGTTLQKTNYGTEQFDIRRVERWLKKVGAL